MKFVELFGSNAEQSYNRMLLQFIQRHFKVKFELELLEIKDVPNVQSGRVTSLIVCNSIPLQQKSPVLIWVIIIP